MGAGFLEQLRLAAANLPLAIYLILQAGFLAPGSTYFLPLPIVCGNNSGSWQISSPVTAAGPRWIRTSFPFQPLEHL